LIIGFLVIDSGDATAASLFLASDVPSNVTENDPNSVELGVKFRSSSAGKITGSRYYKGPRNTGTHTAHLWSATGTLLASATFIGETASGWQQVNFPTPVAITAGTTYIASYHCNGFYSETDNYFTKAHVNAPLTAPDSSSSGGNSVYTYGSGVIFPTNTWLSANYFVDVVFSAITNSPPVANADGGFVAAASTPLTIQASALLANDTDPNGLPLTVTGVSNPTNGAVVLNGTTITFSPKAGYTGAASFTYTIQDTAGRTASANVSLVINPLAPPVANNDMGFVTTMNTPLPISAAALLANDTDPNKLALSVTGVTNPTNGAVTLKGTTITFVPTTGYTGPASFAYSITDTAGGKASAIVSVTVNAASTCGVAYTASGPIVVKNDNQVISNLNITTTSGAGIDTNGHSGVQIKNVTIHHGGPNPGIYVNGGTGVVISGADIVNTAAPASGPNPSSDMNNIACYHSSYMTVNNVRMTKGSSGLFLDGCPNSQLSFIGGHEHRGPFPRGQLVQFGNGSNNSSLTDFSEVNDVNTSWTEDNINVYASTGITIARGLVDGNNSPTGVGVIVESGSGNVTVTDVDAIHQGNGCFSIYSGPNVTYKNANCRDNHCTNLRGTPSSNSLAYGVDPGATGPNLNYESSSYYNLCNPRNVVWDASHLTIKRLTSRTFTPRTPITAKLCP
jgi:hypothetical protein